jgi:general secretion pathway protein A
MRTLADHAMGKLSRGLTNMAAELLAVAAQREITQLDEKLYLDVFARPSQATSKRRERVPSNRERAELADDRHRF